MFSNTNSLVLGKLWLSGPCSTDHGASRVTAGSETGQKQLFSSTGQHAELPSWHSARAGEAGPAAPHPSSCRAGKPSAPHSSSPLRVTCPPPRHHGGQPCACQMTSSFTALQAL